VTAGGILSDSLLVSACGQEKRHPCRVQTRDGHISRLRATLFVVMMTVGQLRELLAQLEAASLVFVFVRARGSAELRVFDVVEVEGLKGEATVLFAEPLEDDLPPDT
jgi:hypothetical protein